jgi:hypothetical protein
MLGAIFCFCAVFLFRRQISGNFPRSILVSVPLVGCLIALPAVLIQRSGTPVADWVAAHRLPATGYLVLAIMTPLAYLILGYRVQEQLFGGPYPAEIRNSIRTDVVDLSFYRKDQVYDLKVLRADETEGGIHRRQADRPLRSGNSDRSWDASISNVSARIGNRDQVRRRN